MKKPAARTIFAKHSGRGAVSEVERRLRQEGGYGLRFVQDLRRALVGDSKDERTSRWCSRVSPGTRRTPWHWERKKP